MSPSNYGYVLAAQSDNDTRQDLLTFSLHNQHHNLSADFIQSVLDAWTEPHTGHKLQV